MVLVVLAVVWIAALTPMVLRKMNERQVTTSVDSFRRQLRGLRRAYPRLAASAAHGGIAVPMPGASSRPAIMSLGAPLHDRGPRAGSARTEVADDRELQDDDRRGTEAFRRDPSRRPAGTRTTKQSTRAMRRRRMLLGLGGTLLGSFALGAIPGFGVLWDLSLLALIATAGYLGLLVYFHRLELERSVKVIDFPLSEPAPRLGIPVTPFDPYVPACRGAAASGASSTRADDSDHGGEDDEQGDIEDEPAIAANGWR